MRNNETCYTHIDSPIGPLLIAGSEGMLQMVSFPSGHGARRPQPHWREDASALAAIADQLREYFSGIRITFEIPFEWSGNAFQKTVWVALCNIPYGETRTYGEIAEAIGQPLSASRAVGAACGENPLPIIVPCHRVVGAGGALVGFGGGLETKRYLLDLEFRTKPPADTLFAV